MTVDMTELDEIYKKWRKLLFRLNMFTMITVFVVEIVVSIALWAAGLIPELDSVYLTRYLLLPTMWNSIIFLSGFVMCRVLQGQESLLNYVPIVQLLFLCAVVAYTHHAFSATLCCFLIPVLTSVVFGDKRLTQCTMAGSVIGVICAALHHVVTVGLTENPYLFIEVAVATFILLIGNTMAFLLLRFQKEKTQIITNGYHIQLEMQERLSRDQKTGLYGYTALTAQLQDSIEQYGENANIMLAMLDLDDFKHINDTYGHTCGDEVILELSRWLKQYCGEDFPARYGGEEFAVLFHHKTLDEVVEQLEQVRKHFSESTYSFTKEQVSVSIGCASYYTGENIRALIDRADAAMYEAKKSGKNCIRG